MSEVVARARRAVGTPFRLHGRGACGLDCVGLVAAALESDGAPTGYPLRGGTLERIAGGLAAAGLTRVERARAGDVVAVTTGPAQLHLLILTDDGFIHADAGLRRVVEVPGASPWPIVAAWRSDVGEREDG